MQPAIIVVGYRRHKSLDRLLKSIDGAMFHSAVRVIISLDGGHSDECLAVAKRFKSTFAKGCVEVIARERNLGLRNHIIWCGDQSERFGSVIVLEDDLVVDPQFYIYSKKAALFYEGDERVAGLSIYAPEFNEYVGLPFRPLWNGTSCYFMQIASSWGQLWTASKWRGFKEWYAGVDDEKLLAIQELPLPVKSWPKTSWKKFYNGYLAQNNKWFVYPYRSYSTNVSDAGGAHIGKGTSLLQASIPCHNRPEDELSFVEVHSTYAVLYDPFMEPRSKLIFDALGYPQDKLALDTYGSKPKELLCLYEYAITSKAVVKYVKSIPLSFRPIENSILRPDGSSESFITLSETRYITSEGPENIVGLTEYFAGINLQTNLLAKALIAAWRRKVIKKVIGKLSA